ncbi:MULTISPECIES: NAD kinase [Pediococcus]|jgi:NAD+ kinase|uniref:NAD kinase n=1 Tax=Pediococcus TaxID=1253 RepID=UPI0007108C39|nr:MULTISPECIES: NAD kinase [Pediococcus]MCT3026620.1 NAD kinase [Pediococcus parvulus]MCT3028688.1 NAD kinase [Pediococcus parvulus]MCT3034392.1 NAD kinase [Pediococcus parvulus]MDN5574568.1 NAD kinase [Pediococcus sp.]GEL90109.1 NAD kinase [Pediococcus parvulus]
MKVAVYSKQANNAQDVADKLIEKLKKNHIPIDRERPDIVVTVGGDGTLLSAFQYYQTQLENVRFIGVHTGHLGFYTDWRDYELDDLISAIKADNGECVGYPILDIDVTMVGETIPIRYHAVNESTIKKVSSTLVADVYFKDRFFERFRGDGLCISTPTGSTAYNRSVGGAVVHPQLEVLQMAEIASINNRVFRTLGASIILAPDEWITLRPAHGGDFNFTADQVNIFDAPIEQIKYRIGEQKINFAKYRHTDFWGRVRNAFIGDGNEV